MTMLGFDILGVEDHIGAAIPDERPVLNKLAASAQRASRAAAKIQRIHPRAAQRLQALSAAATTKGKRLAAAIARGKAKAKAATSVPPPTPAPAPAPTITKTTRATAPTAPPAGSTSYTPRAAPLGMPPPAAIAVPTRPAPSAPVSAPVAARATVSAPAPTTVTKGVRGTRVGLSAAVLQSTTEWIRPMLDVYQRFSSQIDDAGVAGEVIALVEPMLGQLPPDQTQLYNVGVSLIDEAWAIIDSVQYPPDPQENVGGVWLGDITNAGADLERRAIDWVKATRDAIAIYAQAMAVPQPQPEIPPPVPSVPPSLLTTTDLPPELPPMNQVSPPTAGSGGGGGGSFDEGSVDDGGSELAEYPAEEGEGEDEYAEEEGEFLEEDPGLDYLSEESTEEDPFADEESGEYGEDEYSEEEEEEEEEEDMSDEGLDLLGHRGGGGRHGGGGHRHGGHGGRGMRGGGWYGPGPYYGGPWYEPGYGYEVLLLEDEDEDLADKIAKKVAQQQWAAGRTGVGYVAPEKSWFVTPGAIKAEMDKVQREIITLAADISAYRSADPIFVTFRTSWLGFVADYKKFYDENAEGVGGWLSRLWGSIGDQVVNYGNQTNDWRAKFKAFPGSTVTEPPVTSMVRREDPNATNWKPYVIGAGVLVGVGVLGFGAVKIAGAAVAMKKLTRG